MESNDEAVKPSQYVTLWISYMCYIVIWRLPQYLCGRGSMHQSKMPHYHIDERWSCGLKPHTSSLPAENKQVKLLIIQYEPCKEVLALHIILDLNMHDGNKIKTRMSIQCMSCKRDANASNVWCTWSGCWVLMRDISQCIYVTLCQKSLSFTSADRHVSGNLSASSGAQRHVIYLRN